MRKIKRFSILAGLIFVLQLCIGFQAYAADGKLSIAVDNVTVEVGDTVTVTLRATGPNGERAVSDMKFTYDADVFSFVSCSEDIYSGGEGGQVNVSGSTVNIKLKAIAQGTCYTKVTGSNGRISETGETLNTMVEAGVVIESGISANNDNSLQSLSLSAGQLSPEFSYSITEYTAIVPYEVTEVQVNAIPFNEAAVIQSITGNTDLQVGENPIVVTVLAENGETATYTIIVTREAQTVVLPNPEDTVPEDGESNVTLEEYEEKISYLQEENKKLEEKYQKAKADSKRNNVIFIIIIVILLFICVNLILFRKREEEEELDFKKVKKTKADSRETGTKVQETKKVSLQPKDEKKIRERVTEDMNSPEKPRNAVPPEKGVDVIDFDDLS